MIIRSVNEFEHVLSQIEKADKWAVDTEGIIRVYPNWDLVGISISTDGKTGCYIPVGHADGSGQLPADYVVSKLKPFFEQSGKRLYMHNSKYDMKVFRLIDKSINFNEENAFCSMTASFILDVNSEHGLKPCVNKEFDHVMTTLEEVCSKEKDPKTGDKIFRADKSLIEDIAPYAIDDAVQTFRLGELYEERINELGIQKMFYELEIPLMFILMEMEENGIRLDTDKLNSILAEAPQTIDTLKKQITDLLPDEYKDININSLQQLNKLFFEGLKIKPRGDKLKSGIYSVKNEFLLMWSVEHKICELLLEYRKLGKLFGTYLANFNDRISPDGRLRCNFNRHVAATGRLSSSRPNLQNCYDKDTEILTDKGWVFFKDLHKSHKVAQWNTDGSIEFVTPSKHISYIYEGFMVQFKGHAVDLLVTPEHNMLTKSKKTGKIIVDQASDWKICQNVIADRKVVRGGHVHGGIILSDEDRLQLEQAIVIQAEGHLRKDYKVAEVSFRSERKQKQASHIFEMKSRGTDGRTVTYVSLDDECFKWLRVDRNTGLKEFKEDKVLSLSKNDLLWFLDAIHKWDGDYTRKCSFLQHKKHKSVVDLVQAVATLCGKSTSYYVKNSTYDVVNIHHKTDRYMSRISVNHVPYKDMVYCVTVDSGFIVVRRNGSVIVCGNCPRKENDVYGMRDLFIAAPGKVFVCADFSQIELRVEAHLSRDPMFIQAFEDGIDIHSLSAKELFNLDCELDEVQKKYKAKRQIAKSINFGIIYEAGVRTLTATANKELDEKDRITEEQMQGLMDRYFRKYSSIKNYIDYCHRQAIQNGFVKTIVGRKRYLPDAQQKGDKLTKDDMRRKYGALRQASNSPTQGSAADIMAIAMRNIKRRNIAEGLEETTKIILQVHDEIIVETDEQYSEQVAKTVKEEMEQAVSLRVPLEAVVQVGYVWGNMK